jgi:hypothetical protein
VRPRPLTDLYLAAVERAANRPGIWIDVRVFDTEMNAGVTANCLNGGFLRVQPRRGDTEVRVRGKQYIATAAAVEVSIHEGPDGWLLRIRA